MPRRNVYLSEGSEQVLDKIMELNPQYNLSFQIGRFLGDELERLKPKKDEPAVILSQCLYPKFKGKDIKCKWQNCPVIDPTDYPKAKQNLFSKRVTCIFRGG